MRTMALAIAALGLANVASAKPPAETFADRQAAFGAILQTNIGTDINEYIRRVGPPNGQYQMPNGNIIYQFDRSWPGHLICVMNFEADKNGIIVHINVNGCVA